ncbi:hypothetical protein [Salmonella enterica]|uniref:hypothetical protein n=1 Tax=Salmonella enterica TaxID=28901 RepID=UPI0009AC868F|nr:hypothetical protein [Salmonella enterica]EEJ7245735.1 hypothetical protein [Salmonella enterica subsp. enterica]HAF4757440.1 hypothetical protein [Salmonella enterica]HCB5214566.1 hypothetical protein [Salmonella enterica subsp. enterica serovar Sandiego]
MSEMHDEELHQHKTNSLVLAVLDRMANEKSVTRASVKSQLLEQDPVVFERFWTLVWDNPETEKFDFLMYCDECRKFSLYTDENADKTQSEVL